MLDGNNCDMAGCVALFEQIDLEVKEIETFSGNRPDTLYRKEGKVWKPLLANTM